MDAQTYVGGVVGILGWCVLAASGDAASAAEGTFGFDRLRQQAQQLAVQPYKSVEVSLPRAWRDLDYDGYRAITFQSEKALWRRTGLPFRVEFYSLGYLFQSPVQIFVVDGKSLTPVPFSPDLFDYSASPVQGSELPQGLGFAGFRIFYPINTPTRYEEFISFLGASYFRASGRRQMYGGSARGLAIRMGLPEEEFPVFTEFWIEKPSRSARSITVYALLNSSSTTGAYHFDIRPGAETVVAVRAELFPRKTFANLGLAPLTSMYFYGPNGPDHLRHDDRPQVHDSDGLLIAEEANRWTWRPLWNPRTISLSSFQLKSVRGFGLMQRDRDPINYDDTRVLYENRPSLWVEIPEVNSPGSTEIWRQGVVRLLELPSHGEGEDNIGACWVPSGSVQQGQALSVRYRIHFGWGAPEGRDIGKVVATRWSELPPGSTRFEVDFHLPASFDKGQEQGQNDRAGRLPEASVTTTHGQVGPPRVDRDPSGKLWRVSFDYRPADKDVAELRAFLYVPGRTLTETWSFAWPR